MKVVCPGFKMWSQIDAPEPPYFHLYFNRIMGKRQIFELVHPDIHQRKIRTTNLIEGVLNKALKQRSKVIFDIPQPGSCLKICLP